MGWITLTTDFGLEDGYPGIMKGVIWGIAPGAEVADLSHNITAGDILAGALTLERAAPYFPKDTVHVAVVDPGVGTARRPIAARFGGCRFVGPDNGLCTPLLRRAEEEHAPVNIIHLTNPRYWLPAPSRSFHGRDIFAPVGAHLASGVPLDALGDPISDPLRLELPKPQPFPGGLRGQVIHIDHFGNLASNIRAQDLAQCSQPGEIEVRCRDQVVRGLSGTFGDASAGSLVAMIDSAGYLALCLSNGSAAREINTRVGDPFEVRFPPQTTSQ